MRFQNRRIHVTLVRPPVLELRANLSSYGAIPPIGLAYIAAVLRDAGHQITVIDAPGEAMDHYTERESPLGTLLMNGLTPEEIVDRIDPQTDVIGITHMFLHEWPTIREICERAKAKIPDAVVVIGGENATAFWDHIFRETTAVDYCVLGEGERVILELLDCLREGSTTDHLHGVVGRAAVLAEDRWHYSNTPTKSVESKSYAKEAASQLGKRVTDVDSFPMPAWELFPIEQYMQTADHHGVNRGRSMPVLATRGCPYQCTFCSSPQMWTTRYVTRQPRELVREMKYYVERYRAANFNFCDLTAIIKKDWIIEFCQILKEENLGVTWQLPTGTRSEALDDEVLRRVYETGCRNITYAPESGSDRMLHIIKKKVYLPRMVESLKSARQAKLVTRVNIIIGHPEEVRSDTWKSLRFLVQCAIAGCQDAAVMIFAPYPGSEDTKKLVSQGKVTVDNDYYYLPLARSGWSSRTYNPYRGTRELIITQFLMLLVFYFVAYCTHPWRFVGVLRSLMTGQEQTQLDQLLRTKLQRDVKSPEPVNGLEPSTP